MPFPDITPALNRAFGTPGKAVFRAGPNGLPILALANRRASAEMSIHGAQVLSYRPAGQPNVLWATRAATHEPGEPLRGGVPISWPWFSAHEDPALPDHGFAFTSLWQVLSVEHGADESGVLFALHDSAATWRLWPHPFRLTLRVIVGASLKLEMTTENTGGEPVVIRQGFHTYLIVRDIARVTLRGLENTPFFNKKSGVMAPGSPKPVTVRGEVDRVYHPTAAACVLEDRGLGRRVTVAKTGSNSTVVWNPWAEKVRRIRDFEENDHRSFLCVETTNTRGDAVTVPAGGARTLSATITSEPC